MNIPLSIYPFSAPKSTNQLSVQHRLINQSAIMSKNVIVSIDQGTSSSRAVAFSTKNGQVKAMHQIQLTPSYPQSGWLEMDADELYATTLECLNECMKQLEQSGRRLDVSAVDYIHEF